MEQFRKQLVEKSHNLKRRGGKKFVQLRSLRLRSSNRFVRYFTCIFFPSDSFVLYIFKLKRITCTLLLSKIFRYRAQFKGNFFRCVGARAFLRANDAKIVRSRDAQRNTEESPQRLRCRYRKTTQGSLCWSVQDFFKLIASYSCLVKTTLTPNLRTCQIG